MINIGNLEVSSISLGDTEVTNVYLGNYEIYSTSDWRFVALDSNLEECSESGNPVSCYGVVAYKGSDTMLELPSEYKDLPVKKVMYSCFSYNQDLTDVVIPNTYEELDTYAFIGCSSLDTVVFSENLVRIGASCFENCSALTSITLPNSLVTIESGAFQSCTGLTSITIPDNVEELGSSAFYNCNSITSITLNDGLITIGASCFERCSNITTLILPDTVEVLGGSAIKDCDNLQKLSLSANLTTIGRYNNYPLHGTSSDYYRTYLEEVYYNGTIEDWCNISFSGGILKDRTIFYIKDDNGNITFNNQTYKKLEDVNIPNTITSLSQYTFYGFRQLKSVSLPSSLTSIGNFCFHYCCNLISITLPSTLTTIGNYAFEYCWKLAEIYNLSNISISSGSINPNNSFTGNYAKVVNTSTSTESKLKEDNSHRVFYLYSYSACFIGYRGDSTSVTVPTTITNNSGTDLNVDMINHGAFSGCDNLKEVSVPSNLVTSLGQAMFWGCSSIEKIDIPFPGISKYSTRGSNQYPFGALFYGVFRSSYSYTTNIFCRVDEFDNTESRSQTYSSSTTKTASQSVYFPISIKEINITNCTYIPYGALSYTRMQKLSLPEGVTKLEMYSLAYNYYMQSIVLPSTLTEVSNYATNGCNALNTIFYKGDSTQWSNITIGTYNTPLSNATVYYYSETQPSESGNYWHYVSGEPTIWS